MKHLDIGSGLTPKNPYGADELYGIDIQENLENVPNYNSVNLFTNKIPFDSDFFDSISAFLLLTSA